MKLLYTPEQELEIINKYKNEKLSSLKIGKLYSLNHQNIYHILRKHNISRRNKNKRDSFNEDYFETIDTEAKAYLLGFILADGCIYDNQSKLQDRNWQPQVCLQIHNKDVQVLNLLKNETGSNKKVVFLSTRPNCKFSLTSLKMVNDLKKLGVVPRKSLTAQFPNYSQVPKYLFHHFMRGLFDGDGCICNGKRTAFDICGSFDVCMGVKSILCNIVVPDDKNKLPRKQGNIYRMYYFKRKSINLIYHYLYKDANYFFNRKKIIFESKLN